MGRPSKLTDKQWSEIGRRLAAGESMRSLAKEYKVGLARISERFSERVPELKSLAVSIAETERAFETLPVSEQGVVRSLADQIKTINNNLARAAVAGSDTAARLTEKANKEVRDNGDLMKAAMLTKVANDAVAPAMALIKSSQGKSESTSTLEDLILGAQ